MFFDLHETKSTKLMWEMIGEIRVSTRMGSAKQIVARSLLFQPWAKIRTQVTYVHVRPWEESSILSTPPSFCTGSIALLSTKLGTQLTDHSTMLSGQVLVKFPQLNLVLWDKLLNLLINPSSRVILGFSKKSTLPAFNMLHFSLTISWCLASAKRISSLKIPWCCSWATLNSGGFNGVSQQLLDGEHQWTLGALWDEVNPNI